MNLKDRVRTLYARRDELKNAVFMQDVADKRAADDARLAADLEAEIADLASKIRPAESPAVSQQGRTIAALKAGDCITVGNNPIVIARKSQWSLRDTMGLTWSMTEITGLRRERVNALRREMDT